jgi:hypothetical protein
MANKRGRPVGYIPFKVKRGELNKESEKILAMNIMMEDELINVLGINKRILDDLRWTRSFPHINLIKGSRVYLRDSVLKWLKSQEISLKSVMSFSKKVR